MAHLQIKNVPEATYTALRRRAVAEGSTMRDLVLRLLERELSRPSTREWLADLARSRPTAELTVTDTLAALDAAREEIEADRPDLRR
jgi:plasmid stability protein